MKRERKASVKRGNLSGKQRRRIARLFRIIAAKIADGKAADERDDEGYMFIYRAHTPGRFRDAERLQSMGKVVCASSRPSWVYPGTSREIAVFLRMDALLKRYPRGAVMR